jgi:ribose 5-phosphate isomerase B
MRVLMGSDERTPLTDAVAGALSEGGHDLTLVGPVAGGDEEWADVGAEVGRRVAAGEGDRGVLFCWTGTGVSIAANRCPACGPRSAPMPRRPGWRASTTTPTCS